MTSPRQAIERHDFPLVRRGYDPAVVDAHLAAVAADVAAELDRLEQRVAGPLAPAASEQVRSILEAAERSAAAIEQAARDEADRLRADAVAEAERVREEVAARLRAILERVGALETDLSPLERAPAAGADAASPGPEGDPAEEEGGGEEEGARLIALSMALDGAGREETERYLREHFDLPDRERLLDEVWSTIEA